VLDKFGQQLKRGAYLAPRMGKGSATLLPSRYPCHFGSWMAESNFGSCSFFKFNVPAR
jgi:hypothetical protein